jgi:hypothetical protein
LFAACAAAPSTVHLWNGHDLAGWHTDVPAADGDAMVAVPFVARDGLLVTLAGPQGHLITDEAFADYRLTVEWRWPGEPGNSGVLVHASTPRRLYGMFPQSIEVQLHRDNAGDFWCIGEDITVPDMEGRRGPKAEWGVDGKFRRRINNLTDGSERPAGEWNQLVVECRGREIEVWVNGDLVNHGTDCTADRGCIALQAEGSVCEFRRVDLEPLPARGATSSVSARAGAKARRRRPLPPRAREPDCTSVRRARTSARRPVRRARSGRPCAG